METQPLDRKAQDGSVSFLALNLSCTLCEYEQRYLLQANAPLYCFRNQINRWREEKKIWKKRDRGDCN